MRSRHYWARMATAGAAFAIAIVGCSANPSSIAPVPQMPSKPATTTPMDVTPTPTPTPIQMQYATTIGQITWPDGDTSTGGQGQQISGINCNTYLSSANHHHAHLSIFVNGTQLAVPEGTGMKAPQDGGTFVYHAACFYWIHTHDHTGILHMEPPTSSTTFHLGQYFLIWGEPLTNTQVAQFTGTVSAYVNGMLDTTGTNVRFIQLHPGDDITLVIGTNPDWIPAYLLPPTYPT